AHNRSISNGVTQSYEHTKGRLVKSINAFWERIQNEE
ncbi:unnamed protein product, partial [marine sediment metagenome]